MLFNSPFIKELGIDQAAVYIANQYSLKINSSDICHLITSHQLKAYLKLLEPYPAKEDLVPNGLILGTEEPLPHHPDIYYQMEVGAIRAMDLVTLKPQTIELGMINSDILAIQSSVSGENMISSSGLAITLVDPIKKAVYYLYTQNDEPFAYGEYIPTTWIPRSSEIVIKVEELDLLLEKSGYERISPASHSPEVLISPKQIDDTISEKKEKALLRTIGALAKLAAHLGGSDVGTFDKPNASGLLRKLETLADEQLLDGLGESTWIGRVGQGKEAFEKRKIK